MPVSIYSRYYGLETLELKGQVSLTQRLQTATGATPGSITHTIVGNETLDQLAARYYGREDLWWRIADANDKRFPLDWKPGDILIIPPLAEATLTPRG